MVLEYWVWCVSIFYNVGTKSSTFAPRFKFVCKNLLAKFIHLQKAAKYGILEMTYWQYGGWLPPIFSMLKTIKSCWSYEHFMCISFSDVLGETIKKTGKKWYFHIALLKNLWKLCIWNLLSLSYWKFIGVALLQVC